MGNGASIPFEKKTALTLKEDGNVAFKNGLYPEAIYYYSRAINLLLQEYGGQYHEIEKISDSILNGEKKVPDEENQRSPEKLEEKEEKRDLLSVLYSNRSASFLDGFNSSESSLQDAQRCIQIRPSWSKGYFRAGKASLSAGDYQLSIKYFEKALALEEQLLAKDHNNSLKYYSSKTISNIENQILIAKNGLKENPSMIGPPSIYTWGKDVSGILGQGKENNYMNKVLKNPCMTDCLRGLVILDIGCGMSHSVCVEESGDVYAWGNNNLDQLGDVSSSIFPSQSEDDIDDSCNIFQPKLVRSLIGKKINQLACGAAHTIALSVDGIAFAFGACRFGQLGLGIKVAHSQNSISKATEVIALHGIFIKGVSCGIGHSCFVSESGNCYMTGWNDRGQLGLGDVTNRYTPVKLQINDPIIRRSTDRKADETKEENDLPLAKDKYVNIAPQIVNVSLGGGHSCWITADGLAYTAGSGSCGQLGNGLTDDQFFPIQMCFTDNNIEGTGLIDIQNQVKGEEGDVKPQAAFVACGEEFTILITKNRSVYSCGLNLLGQLGFDNNFANETLLSPISSLNNKEVEIVSTSQSTVFALSRRGDIYTWGLPLDLPEMVGIDLNCQSVTALQNYAISSPTLMYRCPSTDLLQNDKTKATQIIKRIRRIESGRNHCCVVAYTGVGAHSKVSYFDETNKDMIEGMPHQQIVGTKFMLCVTVYDEEDNLREYDEDLVMMKIFPKGSTRLRNATSSSSGTSTSNQDNSNYRGAAYDEQITYGLYNSKGYFELPLALYKSGYYSVYVTVNGGPLKGAPFDLKVDPLPTFSVKKCTIWWGSSSDPTKDKIIFPSVIDNEITDNFEGREETIKTDGDEFGRNLHCQAGQEILFLITLRDTYGNIWVPQEKVKRLDNKTPSLKNNQGNIPNFSIKDFEVELYKTKSSVEQDILERKKLKNEIVDLSRVRFSLNIEAPSIVSGIFRAPTSAGDYILKIKYRNDIIQPQIPFYTLHVTSSTKVSLQNSIIRLTKSTLPEYIPDASEDNKVSGGKSLLINSSSFASSLSDIPPILESIIPLESKLTFEVELKDRYSNPYSFCPPSPNKDENYESIDKLELYLDIKKTPESLLEKETFTCALISKTNRKNVFYSKEFTIPSCGYLSIYVFIGSNGKKRRLEYQDSLTKLNYIYVTDCSDKTESTKYLENSENSQSSVKEVQNNETCEDEKRETEIDQIIFPIVKNRSALLSDVLNNEKEIFHTNSLFPLLPVPPQQVLPPSPPLPLIHSLQASSITKQKNQVKEEKMENELLLESTNENSNSIKKESTTVKSTVRKRVGGGFVISYSSKKK